MKWSEQTWIKSLPIYHKILDLPFITELMNGTLAKEKFLFYIQQDVIYLGEFGKVLAGIVVRLKKQSHAEAFMKFAADTIYVEGDLHESFLKQVGSSVTTEPSPSCLLYTGHMRQLLSSASVEATMAGVLPCFWIYKEVGDYILSNQTHNSDNPYQQWINTYGGADFEKAVTNAINICDELAQQCTNEQQQEMTDAFIRSAKLEWMFWNSAWNMEQWPI
ncbi:thiaminase II [Bacteroides ihuae]|uniref:thiaminase II n=1 Tax=Bacteroides ihuae TaxID=1852362 RepID=UPI0008D9E0EE|nr:thiaminase II [Bacteroides ihuae]